MKFLNYIPAILSLCLVIGIIIGYNFNIDNTFLFSTILINIIVLFITYLYSNKKIHSHFLFSFLVITIFILIGILSINIQNDSNNENYFANYSNNKENQLFFKITKRLKPTKYHYKYEIKITSLNGHYTIGKALLNIKKDSFYNHYKVGSIYYTKTKLTTINKPKNPYTFDYNAYLKSKQINYQITSEKDLLFLIEEPKNINKITGEIITKINLNLKKHGGKQDELAIINALLLGKRQDVSKALMKSYQNAGAVHILAVSGLHIGIIFGILLFLFSPLKSLFGKNKGEIIQYSLAVIFIWLYALLAGNSASIIRSVTMFTALAIGFLINRKSDTINNLFLSAFILLLIHPQYLMDIGFQLSYLAVFSILFWQPVFTKFYMPKNKILKLFWTIFTVSLSAQIGILPLSLYYFHQFPALFFVSGMVILPVLGILLGFGFLVIILAYLDVLPNSIATLFFKLIEYMNVFIQFVANKEAYLFKQIFFPALYVLVSYLIIVSVYRLIQKFNYKRLVFVLVSFLLFQISLMYRKFLRESEKEFIVFHQNKNTILGFKQGNVLNIASDLDSIANQHIIKTYKTGTGVTNLKVKKIKNYYQFNQHKILVIDSFGIYKVSVKPEIVLLRKSPKINIERVLKNLKPKIIIADASNYKTYINYYKEKAKELNTPFYNTNQKGAFILKR